MQIAIDTGWAESPVNPGQYHGCIHVYGSNGIDFWRYGTVAYASAQEALDSCEELLEHAKRICDGLGYEVKDFVEISNN
jgi:hypothetical protein